MRYVSLFSGIEAATAAWHRLGWECVAVAEIDRFPNKLLAQKYPGVPNLGDITEISEVDIALLGDVDFLVFGSPCQDLSVAGKRAGLAGERSGLFHDAMRIIRWFRKHNNLRGALWENVPGAFTSNKGADFAVVVGELAGCDACVPPKGWGNEGALVGQEAMVEWSTLDAQWFGVAQRRRRVFAFADFGDWTRRPPILLEPDSLRGDSAPRRGTREDVAGTTAGGARTGGVPSTGEVAHCLNVGGMGRIDYETETMVVCATGDVTHTLKADGFDASEDGTGRGTPIVTCFTDTRGASRGSGIQVTGDIANTLHCAKGLSEQQIIAFNHNAQVCQLPGVTRDTSVSEALTCSQGAAAAGPFGVRRLTPLECERLQAFPDGYTALPGVKDGPRYKALGNSMCVNVMWWIGFKIEVAMDPMWG